jgi:hypothetical protein
MLVRLFQDSFCCTYQKGDIFLSVCSEKSLFLVTITTLYLMEPQQTGFYNELY